MSSFKLERTYNCWNDCLMSGCPGHTATLEVQSTSEAFTFKDGKGQTFHAQPPEMGALISMIFEASQAQVFIESMVDASKETSNKEGE